MNKSGLFYGSLVQQMMSSGSPSWWSMNNMRPPPEQTFPLLPSSPSSSPQMFSPYPQPSTNVLPMNSWHENEEPPESWSQLVLGGLVGDEEKYGSSSSAPNFQGKKMLEIWEDQVIYSTQMAHDHVKQEYSSASGFVPSHSHEDDEKIQQASNTSHPWNHPVMPTISSPRSCLTTSFRGNMLDFSNNKEKSQLHLPDNSSECNSTATGAANKKARVQGSSTPQQTTFKVRKEKLGDRITALHQLVSPFGKTDTASVLLEAIGYIRFLQNQIEALSTPYLAKGSGNKWQSAQGDQKTCLFPEDPGQLLNESGIKKRGPEEQQENNNDEQKKDLKSRGLCLVPVSFTMHVGSDNGADFWAPAFGGSFR